MRNRKLMIDSHTLASDENGLPGPKIFFSTSESHNGQWWNWPIDPDLLTKMVRWNEHHESALECKKDTALQGYRPHKANRHYFAKGDESIEGVRQRLAFEKFLSTYDLGAGIYDYVYCGNCYFKKVLDNKGDVSRIEHQISRTMRLGIKKRQYYQVEQESIKDRFPAERIIHIPKYGPETNLYGVCGYFSAYLSILLNMAIKRSNYNFLKNGANFGNIVLLNFGFEDRDQESGISKEEEDIKQKFRDAKNVQEGANLVISLDGIIDDDGKAIDMDKLVKITPKGELLAKFHDGWVKLADMARNNILSAHRVPPEIMAVFAEQRYSGDLDKIVKMYNQNVIKPIHQVFFTKINQQLPPEHWIAFEPFDPYQGTPSA